MSTYKIKVLCPNGRTVTISASNQTSILQIIEESCLKQGFKPELYDLKHLRRVLDPLSTVQFSGLMKNAQLELVDVKEPRIEQDITVHLSTSNGRLVGQFAPSTTLGDILLYHSESFEGEEKLNVLDGTEPVVVYSMKKVSGELLGTTTLKSLGVLSGKCMLRYCRQLVQKGEPKQANVTSVLRKAAPKENPFNIELSKSDADKNLATEMPMEIEESKHPDILETHHVDPDIVKMHVQNTRHVPDLTFLAEPSTSKSDDESVKSVQPVVPIAPIPNPEPIREYKKIPFTASKKITLYNQEEAPPLELFDEDDAFFELTVNEVRQRQKELTAARMELEEAPLLTKHLRDLEEDKRILSTLNQYSETTLRIYFPDNYVIQASFKPFTTVKEVCDFVKPFLVDSNMEFNLHNAYPPEQLQLDKTLIDSHCTPKARLYFRCMDKLDQYLNNETLAKKSDFPPQNSNGKRMRKDESRGAIPKTNRTNKQGSQADSTKLKNFIKLHK